jgi:hypothetical protein
VQTFGTTRSRPFFSLLRSQPKVAEKKLEVLQETDSDQKDGGDLEVSEQKIAKAVDEKISPDLSADEHTVTESRGDKVQAPSEPELHSERQNNTIFRQVVTDAEAVNKELEHLRENLLSTVEELPEPESLPNSLSHDWSTAGAISNLKTSIEDLTPLIVAETS